MDRSTFVLLLGGGSRDLQTGSDHELGVALGSRQDLVVVAADSGLDRARQLGLPVHHVVGDMDSVDARVLSAAEAAGVRVERHRADKDATDAELALDLILKLAGPSLLDRDDHDDRGEAPELWVFGSRRGRLDHLLADLLMLSGRSTAGFSVTVRLGPTTVTVARPGRPTAVSGWPGEQVSLLAVHEPVDGINTRGMRWPLVGASLRPGSTRGLSNELVDGAATVTITSGVLLVMQEGTIAETPADRDGRYDPSPL